MTEQHAENALVTDTFGEEHTACACSPDCAERIACRKAGRAEPGHSQCGWCFIHDQARHLCFCLPSTPADRPISPGGSES